MKFLIAILTLFSALAHTHVTKSQNSQNYQILPHENLGSEVNEKSFNFIAKEAYRLYLTEAARQKRPMIIKTLDWQTSYFSAWANHDAKTGLYEINFWGGFARLPDMTKRAFIFTACHELGHLLGGTPRITIKGMTQMSTEGQSDLFAAASCYKTFILNNPDYVEAPTQLNPHAAAMCFEKFRDDDFNQNLCMDTMQAARDFTIAINYVNRNEDRPHFDTPDPRVVERTLDSYPSLQCRMDIAMNGALMTYMGTIISIKDLEDRKPCWFKAE